jgi:hypothetical protein
LAAELNFRLPTMEVRSPAILPGGTRANALASIAETSGFSGAGMVSAVVRFAGMFWPCPRLVRVRSWVESEEATRITVLLEDGKTGLPIATNTVAGNSFHEAVSMVAGYIARQVFGMDRSVPRWCYGTADGRDLGAMQLVRLERVYAACPKDVADSRKEQIRILSSSAATVRTAGIVRYELAQLLALQRQHLESLRLHALNAELHDRFYRGRYRLAMSLEMIANPEHYLPNRPGTWDNLQQTLDILCRSQLADKPLRVSAEYPRVDGGREVVTAPSGHEARAMRVSRELAHELLKIAEKDLRGARAQLSVWHVVRDAVFRRTERAVWLPHWRPGHRRALRDGICVAELLIAVRCRLLDRRAEDSNWLKRARVRWHLRRATTITSFIAGDPAPISACLANPHGQWWDALDPQAERGIRYGRNRARRLPRHRSTQSWQAAYNTACVYAALADEGRSRAPEPLAELERRVIVSLRRVMENPRSELDRPFDWIYGDPDFYAMRQNPADFKVFQTLLSDLERQDYPAAFIAGSCPVPHGRSAPVPVFPAEQLTGEQLTGEQAEIRSPVPPPDPVPHTANGTRSTIRADAQS